MTIRKLLNNFAIKHNILDDHGNIYKFTTHSFRHTKAVELINNGMNLLHVQKWLGHNSGEATLHYAKILDDTLRDTWEELRKKELIRFNDQDIPQKFLLEDGKYNNWKDLKDDIDTVKVPLGYCLKPKHYECASQLIL